MVTTTYNIATNNIYIYCVRVYGGGGLIREGGLFHFFTQRGWGLLERGGIFEREG